MWPFKKTARQRRLGARKAPSGAESRWQRFRRAGGIGGALLGVVLYVAAVAMDLYPPLPFTCRLGQYLPDGAHARVAFRRPLTELIETAKGQAQRATPAVFELDRALVEEIAAEVRRLPRRLATSTQPADANELAPWRAIADDPNAMKAYGEQVARLADALPSVHVVRLKDPEKHKPQLRWPQKVELRSADTPTVMDVPDAVDVTEADELAREASRLTRSFAEPLRKRIAAALVAALRANPFYVYRPEASQSLMDAAVAAVEANPPDYAYHPYARGDRIAKPSVRVAAMGGEEAVGLRPDELSVLRAEHKAFRAAEAARPLRRWGRAAGRAVIILLGVVLLCLYVGRYQPKLLQDRLRALGLLIVLLAMLAVNKLLAGALRLNPYVSVLPVLTAAAVLSIAWNQRFALAVGATLAVFVVLQGRSGMVLFLVLLAGTATLVFQLDEIRTRTKLIRAAAVAAGVVFLGVVVTALAAAVPWKFALADAVWAAGCAVAVGFVVQGTLPLIERVFDVATSLTLLEWCDASRPLLRRLAMEAPGTYNHSLQLGAMCEAAAEAIGARGLLARVGAYYHDIGKINKPDYFIENSSGATSPHGKLNPAMSVLIIFGHVKDGVEMAREYGVPKALHEFIATHHGTTLVQYFYDTAAKQRKDDTDRAPDEMEFRYPGPKPQSKEAAILMLADAAESSVRAIGEPAPGRIENQVHTMVSRRLMDGQLDECELTLREVHDIETSLIKTLCSTYHSRIAYPTPAGEKPSAGEREASRQANGAAQAAEARDEKPGGEAPDEPAGRHPQPAADE